MKMFISPCIINTIAALILHHFRSDITKHMEHGIIKIVIG